MADSDKKFKFPEMKTVKIKENLLYFTGGAGANTGALISEKNITLIDAKMTEESGNAFLNEVKKISTAKIENVIITHSDHDHVNGLSAFPESIKIIAHKNTSSDMAKAFIDDKLKKYLPAEIFEDKLEIDFGKDKIIIYHFGPAHTSGDAVVLIKDQGVVYAGDLITIGRDPLIHRNKGGNSFGLVKYLRSLLDFDADIFIPGHNDQCGKKEIKELIERIEMKQEKIKEIVSQGKSLDEMKIILNVAERPATPSGMKFPTLEELIYKDLT